MVYFAAPMVNFKEKVVVAVSTFRFRDKMYARQDELIREMEGITR